MGVRYDVYLKNGNHVKLSYACFGLLNQLPVSRWTVSSSFYPDTESYDLAKTFADQTTPGNLSFVQYLPLQGFRSAYWSHPDGKPARETVSIDGETHQETQNRALKAYFQEMQLLIDDLPMFQGMITVHPLAKCVRVHIKDNEADKVALALFLVRNLAQEDYIHGYRELRHRGYRPRIAAVITHALQFSPKANAFQQDRWYGRCQDESSWVNPATFGKTGFLKMLKQEVEWFQEPFSHSESGYLRDSHYEDEGETFNTSCDRYEEGSGYYRSLNDVFSTEDDETFSPHHHTSSSGMYWDNVPVDVDPVTTYFDPLIEQSGISKSL